MAYITAVDGVFAIVQGAAETGPRASATDRSSPTLAILRRCKCSVKYRELLRPLAPIMTLEAALQWFDLSPGASDDEYNAYNYMVLTARAKPGTRARMPAVVHVDGTARLQIVRRAIDPICHAYLRALGRRIGVEVAVNTSFNIAGPIVQTALQGIETLRRSKGLDALLMFSGEGRVFAAWKVDPIQGGPASHFSRMLVDSFR
jgi:carbamoyltransferase